MVDCRPLLGAVEYMWYVHGVYACVCVILAYIMQCVQPCDSITALSAAKGHCVYYPTAAFVATNTAVSSSP